MCTVIAMSWQINNYRLQAVEKPKPPTVSESTITLIKSFEGVRNKPYYDSEGWLTTGVGHLIKPHETHLITNLSDDQVHNLLRSDLRGCEETIEKSVRVSINQNQFDALASLCFNIGQYRFSVSRVVYLLNQGKITDAAHAFLDWSIPSVLVKRRREEKSLFLSDI